MKADPESFHEVGKLAGVAQYDDDGELKSFMPSNFVFGTAEIDGRPELVRERDLVLEDTVPVQLGHPRRKKQMRQKI